MLPLPPLLLLQNMMNHLLTWYGMELEPNSVHSLDFYTALSFQHALARTSSINSSHKPTYLSLIWEYEPRSDENKLLKSPSIYSSNHVNWQQEMLMM
jgi:hypothetical protein